VVRFDAYLIHRADVVCRVPNSGVWYGLFSHEADTHAPARWTWTAADGTRSIGLFLTMDQATGDARKHAPVPA